MPEMPRKAARDGLPWGARRGLEAWVGGPGHLGAWGHGWAGPGGMGGRAGAPGSMGGGRGTTHSPYTVAHGGICTNSATTRRRHAVKQLLMLQNPPITRQEGTTRTKQPGHDAWERLQRPRRQLNHHERSLGSAAPSAPPASDVPTRRVTGPQRSWLSECRPGRQHIRIGKQHPDRKPTSGYLNNLSGCA